MHSNTQTFHLCLLIGKRSTDHAERTYDGWVEEEDWVSVAEHIRFAPAARSQQRDTDEDSERHHLTDENNTHCLFTTLLFCLRSWYSIRRPGT